MESQLLQTNENKQQNLNFSKKERLAKKRNSKNKKKSWELQAKLNYSNSLDLFFAENKHQAQRVCHSSSDILRNKVQCEEDDSQETKDSNDEENEEVVLLRLNKKFDINLQINNNDFKSNSQQENQTAFEEIKQKITQDFKMSNRNLPKSPCYQKENAQNLQETKQVKESAQQNKQKSSRRCYKLLESIINNLITDELKLIPQQPKSPTLDQSVNLSQYSDSNFDSPLMNESQNLGLNEEDSFNFEIKNMPLNEISTPVSDFSFNNSPITIEDKTQISEFLPIGKKLEFKELIEGPSNEKKINQISTSFQQCKNEKTIPKLLQSLERQRPRKQLEKYQKPSFS